MAAERQPALPKLHHVVEAPARIDLARALRAEAIAPGQEIKFGSGETGQLHAIDEDSADESAVSVKPALDDDPLHADALEPAEQPAVLPPLPVEQMHRVARLVRILPLCADGVRLRAVEYVLHELVLEVVTAHQFFAFTPNISLAVWFSSSACSIAGRASSIDVKMVCASS